MSKKIGSGSVFLKRSDPDPFFNKDRIRIRFSIEIGSVFAFEKMPDPDPYSKKDRIRIRVSKKDQIRIRVSMKIVSGLKCLIPPNWIFFLSIY